MTSARSFDLPRTAAATAPPERRGLARERVRMLVAYSPDRLVDRRVDDLPRLLRPGDVLVLNGSDTLPASLRGVTEHGERVEVHLSTVDPSTGVRPADALRASRSTWIVEVRTPAGPASTASWTDRTGVLIRVAGGGRLRFEGAHVAEAYRLWRAVVDTPEPLLAWLRAHGDPIRYDHVSDAFPLSDYRTPYADATGSAEMPSAGRSLTAPLLRRLRTRGIEVARLVLHAGVSSPETGEPPFPEWYEVPEGTLVRWLRPAGTGGGWSRSAPLSSVHLRRPVAPPARDGPTWS